MHMSAAHDTDDADKRKDRTGFERLRKRIAGRMIVDIFPCADGENEETRRRHAGKKCMRIFTDNVRVRDE